MPTSPRLVSNLGTVDDGALCEPHILVFHLGGEREVWTIQTHNHGGAGECLPTCVYKMHGVCICICTHTSFCCLYYRCVHIYIYNYIYRRFAFQTIWIIYYLHLFTKATWTVTICLDIICIIVRYTLDDDVNFPEQRVHKFSLATAFLIHCFETTSVLQFLQVSLLLCPLCSLPKQLISICFNKKVDVVGTSFPFTSISWLRDTRTASPDSDVGRRIYL